MKFIFSTISRNGIFSFSAAVICFLSAYFIEQNGLDNHSSTLSSFESVLHKKEAIVHREMNSLLLNIENISFEKLFANKIEHYNRLYEKEGIVFLVYDNDSLKFWTDQSVAVENYLKEVCLDDRLVQLKNGWFEVYKKYSHPKGTRSIYGLILLKKEYAFQNHYLINEYQHAFPVSNSTKIYKINQQAKYPVKSSDGNFLCSLRFEERTPENSSEFALIVMLNVLGFLLSFFFIKNECNLLSRSLGIYWSSALFIGIICFLRFLTIKMHFPEPFYESELFSPKLYGDANSFWLPSLGDFLINALLIFYSAYFIHKYFEMHVLALRKLKFSKTLLIAILILFIFFLSMMLNNLFAGLINNSNISFNINNLFDLTIYSYIAFILIALLLFSFFLITDKLIEVVRTIGISVRKQILIFTSCIVLYVLLSHLYGIRDLILILWSPVIISVIVLIKREPVKPFTFSGVVILLLLISLFSVHALLKFTGSKEKENRKVYAEKLSVEQDPVAEYLFSEMVGKIESDTSLINILYQPYFTKETLSRKLIQKYFGGYWEKYDVRIFAFDTACFSILGTPNPERDNLSYFEEIVRKRGQPTANANLFYVDNPEGKINYLARLKLYRDKKENIGELFIEFESKFVSEEIGFPELLLDREVGLNKELSNYSYAKYKKGNLLNYHGNYQYSLASTAFPNSGTFLFTDKDGYNHLQYRPDKNSLVVLSKKNQELLSDATTFSYLFAFFSSLILLFLLIRKITTRSLFSSFNFKNKIQYLLVLIVLISLGLFGWWTIFYINQQYESTNRRSISDKMISALVEMRQELGQEEQLSQNSYEYLTYVLKRISNVFFTDINLYDTHGNLLASSSPKVFEEGLMSKKMCPQSFYELSVNKKLEYTHNEEIGALNYFSAYVAFKNNNGKLLGYLNLPYFAKQSELEKEISTFLVALINIYVLLFTLSVVAAVFISNYVTKPLKLIQDKMSKIKLGKTNEPIHWLEEDEIGGLVKEYNRMISELQKSAELLARSERESAWREMAKQVAHEIKNPLTPMKLSVQHLQRLIHNKTTGLEEKITELSKTLIEQIETLSTIANEFSNFAKMPKANETKINLREILTNAIHLFKDSFDNSTEIKFSPVVEGNAFVFADKEQLLRVFNNLIKNAAQATSENIHGKIEISLLKKDNNFIINVKDNGTGISEEAMEKIFIPNFTTKNDGMGLGLAMVKNIVESCNGKIWFETVQGRGTTFFVSLPENFE